MKNTVKAKLKAGETSVGAWVSVGHPDVSEALANVGFDWIVFDMEHCPLDIGTIQTLMQSMSYTRECVPIVRVAWNDIVLIKRALDIGAHGLIIPWVNTREEAVNAVRYCKYPPEGVRGFGPRRAAMFDSDYVKTANKELLVAVQIETETAIRNLDEIVSVEGVDACFVGPWDLSMSMGIFEEWGHPRLRDAFERVVKACGRWGVAPGMACGEDNINEAIAQGFRFCSLGGDIGFMVKGATDSIRRVKGWSH